MQHINVTKNVEHEKLFEPILNELNFQHAGNNLHSTNTNNANFCPDDEIYLRDESENISELTIHLNSRTPLSPNTQ